MMVCAVVIGRVESAAKDCGDGARPAPGFPDLLRPFLPRPNVLPQPNTVGAAAVGGNATVAETTAEAEATDEADIHERGE